MKTIVAGATSVLGREVCRLLAERGHAITAVGRDEQKLKTVPGVRATRAVDLRDAAQLRGALDGHEALFSCVGASVQMQMGYGWRGYRAVDVPANLNLLAEARRAELKRFVYVAVHRVPGAEQTAYFAAHEQVAQAILASGIPCVIVRPPAFFSALGIFVSMAKKGKLPVIGDGSSRSNPIDDRDLALACADAVDKGGPRELDIGGPEVLTRLEIARLACEAAGVAPGFRHVPPGLIKLASLAATPVSPRIAQFMRFVAVATTTDVVAPQTGTRKLGDYFKELATR